MGATLAGLRYPELTDSPNAQTAVKNLADDLNARHIPIFATTTARDTAFASPTDGQVCYVTALDKIQLRSGGAWVDLAPRTLLAVKSADTSRASTASLTNDPHLALTVASNSTYLMEVRLVVFANTVVPDFQIGFAGPASATLDRWSVMWNNTGSSTSSIVMANLAATRTNALDAALDQEHQFSGTLVTSATAGTFAFRWAQGISDTTATVVRAGSWMRLTRL